MSSYTVESGYVVRLPALNQNDVVTLTQATGKAYRAPFAQYVSDALALLVN